MNYLSICSGIEAATVAWKPLGFKAVAFAEIEKFPSAVLKHHYPHVPNLGDMTQIDGTQYNGAVDILVGGTPCQSFSVAGLRQGLKDERGNLALEFIRIANEINPAFVIWENVPGVFSDKGNAFGCFLGALAGEEVALEPPGGKWTNAGYVLGPQRTIAWRTIDAQYFGLAQRRKRVFVIACAANGADPREILFEFNSLRRDFAPSREEEEDVADPLKASSFAGGIGGKIEEACSGYLQLEQWPASPTVETYSIASNIINRSITAGGNGNGFQPELSYTMDTGGNPHVVANTKIGIRKLTPVESERLQGFSDGYTQIPLGKKSAAGCPDSPRYKALGNSMPVPVMNWIGRRIKEYVEG